MILQSEDEHRALEHSILGGDYLDTEMNDFVEESAYSEHTQSSF